MVDVDSRLGFMPAVIDYGPTRYGAVPANEALWACARGGVVPATTEEYFVATLFGHCESPALPADASWNQRLIAAACGGHVRMLQAVPEAVFLRGISFIVAATMMFRGGQRETGSWLLTARSCSISWDVTVNALGASARLGDVVGMAWLWGAVVTLKGISTFEVTSKMAEFLARAWEAAGLNAHVDVIRWLLGIHPKVRSSAMILRGILGAAAGGCGEIVQLLRGRVTDNKIVSAVAAPAARCGHLRPLQTLRALQPPFLLPAGLLEIAAAAGRREVIEYLQSPAGGGPHPWSTMISTAAARDHRLDLLVWLAAQGCPVDSFVSLAAATKRVDVRDAPDYDLD